MHFDHHVFPAFGWFFNRRGFCLGRYLYKSRNTVEVCEARLADVALARGKRLGPPEDGSGNLLEWSAAASLLFGPSVEQAWIVLASFASPLLHLTKLAPAGYLAACHGGRGSGKGVAILAAATAWGDPEGLTIGPTEMGRQRYESLVTLGHLPAIITSIAGRDPMIAHDFVTGLAAGPARVGMSRGTRTWRNVGLLESRVSLYKQFEDPKTVPALDNPLWYGFDLNTYVSRSMRGVKGALERELLANRGWAGHAFISWLMVPKQRLWAEERIAFYIERGMAKATDGRYGPRIIFISCMLVAAEILNRAEIMEISVERLMRAAAAPGLLGSPQASWYQRPARHHVEQSAPAAAPALPPPAPEGAPGQPAPESPAASPPPRSEPGPDPRTEDRPAAVEAGGAPPRDAGSPDASLPQAPAPDLKAGRRRRRPDRPAKLAVVAQVRNLASA